MSSRARLVALALGPLVTLVACPGRQSGPPSAVASVTPVPSDAGAAGESTLLAAVGRAKSPDDVNRLLTKQICDRAVRCGTIGESQRPECLKGLGRSRLTLVWGTTSKLSWDVLDHGRVRFDASRSKACVSAWLSASCYGPWSLPEGCSRVPAPVWLEPTVAPGGTCSRFDECVDGFCSSTAAGCDGRCIARSPTGGECGPNQVCQESDFCEDGRCRPRAKLGEECGGHYLYCEDGLFCEGYLPENESVEYGYPEQKGHCSRPKPEGSECFTLRSDEICDPRLFCDWGARSPKCRRRLSKDSECRWLDACAEGLVCRGLVLEGRSPTGANRIGVSVAGRCEPILDLGSTCDPAATVTGCPQSMICQRESRTCRSKGHPGDPCDSAWCAPNTVECHPNSCFASLYCDPKSHTCQPQHAEGESCVPRVLGRDDNPCFLSDCDEKSRRCALSCR